MKRLLLSVVALAFIAGCSYSQEDTSENLHLWNSPITGLNTRILSQNMADTYLQDCDNVFFDEDMSIIRRGGFTNLNTTAISNASVRFIDEYSRIDGSRFMIAVSSNILAYTSTATFTTLLSTLSVNSSIWGVQYNNKYFIGEDGGDSWEFDGAVLRSTGIPHAKYALCDYDKIFVANINETDGGSKIEYSRTGLAGSFEGDAYIYFNKDDGEELTGIVSYGGNVYVFKPHSFGLLIGVNDDYPDNDGIVTVNKTVGCLSKGSVQIKDGYLVFQSARGVEAFDGSNIMLLSDIIKPTIDTISNVGSNTSQWLTNDTFTGSNEEYFGVNFVGGQINPEPRYMVASSGNVGTVSSIDIDSLGNTHIAYITDSNLQYSSYTATTGSWTHNTFPYSATFTSVSLDLDNLNCPHLAVSYSLNGADDVLYSSYTTNLGWNGTIISMIDQSAAASTGNGLIKVDIVGNPHIIYTRIGTQVAYSSYTATSKTWSFGVPITAGTNQSFVLDGLNKPHVAYLDSNTVYYSSYTASTGWKTWTVDTTVLSQNTGIVLDSLYNPHVVYTADANGGLIRVSSFNYTTSQWELSGDSVFGWYPSIAIDSNNKCLISYYANQNDNKLYLFSKSASGSFENYALDDTTERGSNSSIDVLNNKPIVSYYDATGDNLYLYAGYMYYQSLKKDVSSSDYSFNGWATFEYDAVNNPSILDVKSYVFTANTLATLGVSSSVVLDGQTINSANSPFVMYKFIFDALIPTNALIDTSYVDDVAVNFNINESAFEPASIIDNQRYWLSVAEQPNVNNTLVLVLDRNNNWSKFDGIKARSMCKFRDETYFGSSDNNGLIYRYSESYTTDASTQIATMIKTKDFDLGSRLNDKRIAMEGVWTATEPSVSYSTMTFSYFVNKSTTAVVTRYVDINPRTSFNYTPVITRLRDYTDRFRYINFKVQNFYKFNGLDMFYIREAMSE